jgi:hypothetical protein
LTHARSHRPRRTPARLAIVAAAGLALGPAASADAQRWSSPDPAGDVTGAIYDPEPAPCGTITSVDASTARDVDLTGLAVRHQRRDVTVELGVADLPESGTESMTVHLRTAKGAWAVDLDRTGRTGFGAFFYEEPDWDALIEQADPDGDGCAIVSVVIVEAPCPGLEHRGDPDLDVVRLTVPRSCLGRPHWVRVAAESMAWRDADGAFLDDRWAPDGVEPTSVIGPFGPRVKAGPVAVTQTTAAPGTGRAAGAPSLVRHLVLTVTPDQVTAVLDPLPVR